MITSKLTAKARITIPQAVREALHLQPGDELVSSLVGDRVVMTKRTQRTFDDPFGAFVEWSSEADCSGYRDL